MAYSGVLAIWHSRTSCGGVHSHGRALRVASTRAFFRDASAPPPSEGLAQGMGALLVGSPHGAQPLLMPLTGRNRAFLKFYGALSFLFCLWLSLPVSGQF